MTSRRRLSTIVLGTAVVLLASAGGSYAESPEPTPVVSETPEATPAPTPESTPEPTPTPTPEPTPEPSPEAPEPTFEANEVESVPAAEPPVVQPAQPASTKAVVALNPTVDKVTRSDLPYTYRPGCPVGPSGLRLLTVTHLGFDKTYHRGQIVVRTSAVDDVKAVFGRALEARFPIRLMRPVDRYKGSDERSMRKDNTSAFNCRHVVGNPSRLSQHSYGNAVDVNTKENPYVTGSRVYPPGSSTYLNRSNVRKGMLVKSGPIPKEFASRRWLWGARWNHPDYQHFSSNGR